MKDQIDVLKEIQHLQNDFAEAEKQGNFSHEEINWIRSFAGKLDKIAEALKRLSEEREDSECFECGSSIKDGTCSYCESKGLTPDVKELKEQIENLSFTAYAELHRKKENPSYGEGNTARMDVVDAKKVIRILVERIINILPVTKPKGSMSIEELIFSQVRLLADVYKRSLPKQFILDLDTLITSYPYPDKVEKEECTCKPCYYGLQHPCEHGGINPAYSESKSGK